MPGEIILAAELAPALLPGAELGRVIVRDESADLVAKGDLFGRKVEVHTVSPVSEGANSARSSRFMILPLALRGSGASRISTRAGILKGAR